MKFSKMIRRVCLFSVAAVVFSATAAAQQGGDGGGQPPQGRGQRGGGGGGGGGFGGGGFGMFGGGRGGGMMAPRFDRARLLGIEQVRTELKIDDAQSAVIDAALDAYREEQNNAPRPDRDAVQNMSEEERTKMFTDMQKQRDELSKKTDEVLNALLEETQKGRLDQISLQLRIASGVVATLKADDIKGKLKISDDQVAKLDEAEKASQADMMKMFEEMRGSFGGGRPGGGAPGAPAAGGPGAGGPGAGFEAMREKMEAARKKSTDAAMAVLSDDQKKQLEEMQGAKFEIDMRAMMGGRGGFGGGPGGPGGGGPGGQGGRGQRGGQGGQGGRGTRPQAE